MTPIYMNPSTQLTEKEPWRLECMFDLIWWDIKDSLKMEQDRRMINKAEKSGQDFTALIFKNSRVLKYFR